MFSLKGKTALITGGAGFLGAEFCKGLAEFGANIGIVDVSMDAVMPIVEEVRSTYGVECMGYECDVSDEQSVEKMATHASEGLGQINILVNNAATKTNDLKSFFASYENYCFDEWKKVMAVNIDGMFLVSRAIGRGMVKQGGGSIIQTSSIYGMLGPDNKIYEGSNYLGGPINTPAVYSASKAAVIGLTKYLATYWASSNIRVNTLVPGGVESGQNELFKKNYSARVPLNRMAHKSEMLGALIYLASDASSYVTGQEIIVDGGLSCW